MASFLLFLLGTFMEEVEPPNGPGCAVMSWVRTVCMEQDRSDPTPCPAGIGCRQGLIHSMSYFVTVGGSQAALVKFGHMVEDATKRPAMLSFSFYGCYCGLGGQGSPVDEIDWCCERHDCCYGAVMEAGCTPLSQDYHYSYINGVITCDDEELDGCARASCECDREISLCFQKFNNQYNDSNNFNFGRDNCSGKPLPCAASPPLRIRTTYTNTGGGEPDPRKGGY